MNTSWKRIVTEGLVLGGIGYATTVVFFALTNLLSGRSIAYTPAVLGSVFFYGIRDISKVTIWAGPIIAFNGVYLVLALVFGTLLAWLVSAADRGAQFLYLAVFVVLFGALHMTVPAIVLSSSLGEVVPLWSLILAGALAGAAIVFYLYLSHPHLREEMDEELEMIGI